MYEIAYGSARGLPEVTWFVETVEKYDELFCGDGDIFIARAPGRLDVMGGIADYSGSMVLEMPTREATLAALQQNKTGTFEIVSLPTSKNASSRRFKMPLTDFGFSGVPIDYPEAQKYFRREQSDRWAAYVAGVFLVLTRERGVRFAQGAQILIGSDIPAGKGVSSSAAIEVAVMNAVCAAYDIKVEPRELALLCQKVENLVVDAPCGVMDQMSSNCGVAGELLAMMCQPAELLEPRKIPDEIGFWGIDSGVRHSIGAGDYGTVRTGAFMGYRIIAEIAGLNVEPIRPGVVRVDDEKWHGCLANISTAEFEREFAARLPDDISGAEFLQRYYGITDTVTIVDPQKTYAVRKPAAHPVFENARVHRFAQLLDQPVSEDGRRELGQLMYIAHKSYTACGLGTEATDLLVSLVKNKGDGLYGAKITGGGSGGTVAVLGRADAANLIEEIADEYYRQTNYRPHIFFGSSPGAADFGYIRLSKIKEPNVMGES